MVSYDRLITDISIDVTGRSELIAILVLITNLPYARRAGPQGRHAGKAY